MRIVREYYAQNHVAAGAALYLDRKRLGGMFGLGSGSGQWVRI